MSDGLTTFWPWLNCSAGSSSLSTRVYFLNRATAKWKRNYGKSLFFCRQFYNHFALILSKLKAIYWFWILPLHVFGPRITICHQCSYINEKRRLSHGSRDSQTPSLFCWRNNTPGRKGGFKHESFSRALQYQLLRSCFSLQFPLHFFCSTPQCN